jgi:hypothetical protein
MNFLSEAIKKTGLQRALELGASHPTVFFAAGVTGMVASTVLACRATLKLEETLVEFDPPVEQMFEASDAEQMRTRVRAALAVAKLYAPAFVVGAASITMLTKSHSTLVKRNAALSAAYTVLDKGFRDYRSRVVEKYGEDEDERLRYGSVTETVKEGSKNVKVNKVNPETGASIYAVFFDELNPNWDRDPEINKLFLRAQQNYLNDLLHARGHVFLNEAYTAIGADHTQAGSVVGWILSHDGDNYIDLGVFNGQDGERIRDFMNGREGAVLLDFNVDGLIWDKISKHPGPKKSQWYRIGS